MDLIRSGVGICAAVGEAVGSEAVGTDYVSVQEFCYCLSMGIIVVFFRDMGIDFNKVPLEKILRRKKNCTVVHYIYRQ